MSQDVTQYVKHCDICQRNKISNQKRFGLLQVMPVTNQPFECLPVHTVGDFNY